jgi:hypothetical protein
MGPAQCTRQPLRIGGRGHDVNMIGHQAKARDANCVSVGVAPQQGQIEPTVLIAEENLLLSVATLRSVMPRSGNHNPSEPSHSEIEWRWHAGVLN